MSKFRASLVQTGILTFALLLVLLGAGHLARATALPGAAPLVVLADAVLPLDAGVAPAEVADAGMQPVPGSEPAEPTSFHKLPPGVPTDIDSLDSWGKLALLVVQAVQSRDWQFRVGLVLIVCVFALRKLAAYVRDHKTGWQG